jgi:hypothetical protein
VRQHFLVQLTTTHVDSYHVRSTVLQQAIGEPASGRPNVETIRTRHIDTEVLECAFKFDSTSTHKTISYWRNMNSVSWGHHRSSIAHHCPIYPHTILGERYFHVGRARQQAAVQNLAHY